MISEFLTSHCGFIFFCADQTRFVGVAPEANLLSFKVFSRDGYSNEETVIEGFLKAFESGVSYRSLEAFCPGHAILNKDHH